MCASSWASSASSCAVGSRVSNVDGIQTIGRNTRAVNGTRTSSARRTTSAREMPMLCCRACKRSSHSVGTARMVAAIQPVEPPQATGVSHQHRDDARDPDGTERRSPSTHGRRQDVGRNGRQHGHARTPMECAVGQTRQAAQERPCRSERHRHEKPHADGVSQCGAPALQQPQHHVGHRCEHRTLPECMQQRRRECGDDVCGY